MKFILLTITLFVSLLFSTENRTNVSTLSESEISNVFPQHVQKELGITFGIFKAYRYQDSTGIYYLLLTENTYKKKEKEIFNDKIKAFCFKDEKKKLVLQWMIQDNYKPNGNSLDWKEKSIWFWTKYLILDDIDEDGKIDPIIVYGTGGESAYDYGRINFELFYKNQRISIKHQNSELDSTRNTEIDKNFFDLPKSFYAKFKTLFNDMNKNNHAKISNNLMTKRIIEFNEKE